MDLLRHCQHFLKSFLLFLKSEVFDFISRNLFSLQAQKKELDIIRQEYHRKNSLARSPSVKNESLKISGKHIDEED